MTNKNSNALSNIVHMVPGVIFLLIVGLVSKFVGGYIPHVSYLIVAIALGIIISNTISMPAFIEHGINSTYKIWLETGIVVLGARIVLADFLNVGPTILWMVIAFLIFTLLIVEFLASRFGLDKKFGSALASGTSVCGVSAIIATSGGIEPKEKHIAYAITTILIFDVVTVFLYPALGVIFSIPDKVFGVWAGISMFSTGTTVAAGFAHSDAAGQMATIVKMARNVFIGIWALLYTIYYLRKGMTSQVIDKKLSYIWQKFPKMIIGFVIAMIVASSGLMSDVQIGYMKNAYNWLFMLAFVGLGYNINISEMKNEQAKPLLVVLIAFIITSAASFGLAYLFFS